MIFSKLRQAIALVALAVLAAAPALAQIPSATGTITTANLNGSTGACTPGSCVEIEVSNKGVVDIQTVGTYTVSGGLIGKVTVNGIDWITLGPTPFTRKSSSSTALATIASGVQDVYQVSSLIAGALKFRIEPAGAVTGSVDVALHSSPTSIGSAGGSGGGTDGVAQGSTTAAQAGPLMQAAAVSGAQSYSAGTTNPVTTDLNGYLKVNVVAGGAGGGNVTGGTAHDAVATSVNPVLTGGYASAAAPTNVSLDGDAVRDWNLLSGAKVVQPSFGGTLATTGNGTVGAGVQRVTIASDSTGQLVLASGANTIGALTANQSVNIAQVAGTTTAAGSGAVTSGTIRITEASDSPLVAATGAAADAACGSDTGSCSEIALRKRELQHLTTINTSINAANQSVNVAQMNGVATSMGAGVNGTGVQRVTIATDDAMSTAIVGVAHDAAAATVNPALVGCYASAAAPTNVSTDTDATRAWCLLNGSRAVTPTYAGVLPSTGLGASDTGTPRVATAAYASSAAVTLTRTADAVAYTANDVVGSSVSATSALTFASMCPVSGGNIMLTTVAFEIDATAVISGETSYRLYLYNVTPPSAIFDNVAFDLPSGDRASYLGYVDLGTPVDLGSTLYVQTTAVNKQLKCSGTSLFGYLVTNGAYTPTSARVHVVTLNAVGL